MRKLNTLDVFKACSLVEELGIKEAIIPVIKSVAEKGIDSVDAVADIGITGILTIVGSVGSSKGRKAIGEFLADIKGCTVEEFFAADLDEFGEFLEELKEENKDSRFFDVLFRFLTRK